VIPEFRIGSRFRCDFVVMQSYSGGWNIEFVELEPVNVSLCNKDRTPSKPLRIALNQIDDWKRFLETDGATMRSQLADAAKKNDLLQPDLNLGGEPSSFAGDDLRHPFTHIRAAYNPSSLAVAMNSVTLVTMSAIHTVRSTEFRSALTTDSCRSRGMQTEMIG
jgi:hypothetical protein